MTQAVKATQATFLPITRATRCCFNCEHYALGYGGCGYGQQAVCVADKWGDCAVGYKYSEWPKVEPMHCCEHYHRRYDPWRRRKR